MMNYQDPTTRQYINRIKSRLTGSEESAIALWEWLHEGDVDDHKLRILAMIGLA